MPKFNKGDLVCLADEPYVRGLVTHVSPSGGLTWVLWMERPHEEPRRVYSRILQPCRPLTSS